MVVRAGKSLSLLDIGKPSTTIPVGSTSQAYGDGKSLPLTRDSEGEEIVCSRLERG